MAKEKSLSGWRETTLKEIADIIDPHPSHRTPSEFQNGIPYVGMGDIDNNGGFNLEKARKVSPEILDEHRSRYQLQKGDFIFGKIGTIGKPFKVRDPFKYVLSANVILVQPKPAMVHPGFLFSFMASPYMEAKLIRESRATTQAAFGILKARELSISLPPLPEQERIVAKIEELFTQLDAGTAALKRVQAGLKRYKASVLKAAVEGRLFENREVESSDQLPDGWRMTTISELTLKMQYGTSEKAGLDENGIVVLRMGNIQNGELDFGNLKYLSENTKGLDGLILEPGDILFNRTNSAELVGKTAIYRANHPRATLASYLIRLKVKTDIASPDFISFYINSFFGRKYISSVVSQQVGQANVNGTKLSNMPIPLPPLAEQLRIVAEVERRLEGAAQVESALVAAVARASRLRQAVLKSAFEGKLV